MSLAVRLADPADAQTAALLTLHQRGMHANSPPGHCFVLDLAAFASPDIRLWSAWDGAQLAAIGALRLLSDGTGEVKSMRTHPDHLRRGAAGLLLEAIIADARAHGCRRLSLETGSGPAFEPALALYRRRGFQPGGAFGDYVGSDFNRFFHLDLGQAPDTGP